MPKKDWQIAAQKSAANRRAIDVPESRSVSASPPHLDGVPYLNHLEEAAARGDLDAVRLRDALQGRFGEDVVKKRAWLANEENGWRGGKIYEGQFEEVLAELEAE